MLIAGVDVAQPVNHGDASSLLAGVPASVPVLVAVALTAWRMRPRARPRYVTRDAQGEHHRGAPQTPPTRSGRASSFRFRSTPKLVWPRQTRLRVPDGDEVAMWCDAISRQVRSGTSLAQAVPAAERSSAVEAALSSRIDRFARSSDSDLQTRCATFGRGLEGTDVGIVATVLETLAVNGGSAAEAIDRTAAVLRARAAARAERSAHCAQARMSALVMTWLPVAMLATMCATSAAVRAALVSPAGAVTVLVGAVLNGVGWRWMSVIINKGTR